MATRAEWEAAHPRGRESGEALTEIRTVLSRAESALERIGPEGTETEWLGRQARTHPAYDELKAGQHEDPDANQMRAALQRVIDELEPWRKTGSTRWTTCL